MALKQSLSILLTFELAINSINYLFISLADPLVQHFQQFYDGYLLGWTGVDDFDANITEGLPEIQ